MILKFDGVNPFQSGGAPSEDVRSVRIREAWFFDNQECYLVMRGPIDFHWYVYSFQDPDRLLIDSAKLAAKRYLRQGFGMEVLMVETIPLGTSDKLASRRARHRSFEQYLQEAAAKKSRTIASEEGDVPLGLKETLANYAQTQ